MSTTDDDIDFDASLLGFKDGDEVLRILRKAARRCANPTRADGLDQLLDFTKDKPTRDSARRKATTLAVEIGADGHAGPLNALFWFAEVLHTGVDPEADAPATSARTTWARGVLTALVSSRWLAIGASPSALPLHFQRTPPPMLPNAERCAVVSVYVSALIECHLQNLKSSRQHPERHAAYWLWYGRYLCGMRQDDRGPATGRPGRPEALWQLTAAALSQRRWGWRTVPEDPVVHEKRAYESLGKNARSWRGNEHPWDSVTRDLVRKSGCYEAVRSYLSRRGKP